MNFKIVKNDFKLIMHLMYLAGKLFVKPLPILDFSVMNLFFIVEKEVVEWGGNPNTTSNNMLGQSTKTHLKE